MSYENAPTFGANQVDLPMHPFQKELLASDDFAQYSLRSSFFVRKLRGLQLWEAIAEVEKIARLKASFKWNNRSKLGIEEESWQKIQDKGINPVLFFCHPRVITEQPRLLLYYRTLALISQKGLSTLASGPIARVEAGKVDRVNSDWLQRVVLAINSLLSAIVKSAADIGARDFSGFQFAAAGSTIQGSWNNAVGTEGELTVRTILLDHLRDEVVQIVWSGGGTMDYTPEVHTNLIDRLPEVRVVRLKSGHHLFFSSEPDISLRNPDDFPLVAIEVKAGTDPAGALERLGAAMKSFENDRNANPRVKTIYVVRCITPELQRRISHTSPFDHTFGLAELLVDEKTQKTFANIIVRTILGK